MAKKGTKKAAIPTTTLREVCDRYLANMETAGKSIGTCTSYKGELQVAMDELGADTLAAAITPAQIQAFNESARVTKLRKI